MTEEDSSGRRDPRRSNRRGALAGSTRRDVLAGSAAVVGSTLLGASASAAIEGTTTRDRAGTEIPQPSGDRIRAKALRSSVSLEGVESMVDDHMAAVVEDGDVVGAAAAVVRSDETVFAKGYGRTHAEGGDPVDGETPFRLGSVSKPFVWTAAMQQIEAGRIDPDEDVRPLLEGVSIEGREDEPITMAHLATHTAGFEERNQGLWVEDPAAMGSLDRVLDDEQPTRVRSPGEFVSYSNYGTALAGQVVADVAGRSLPAYLEEAVLEPLGMTNATFEQPPPEAAAGGYTAALGAPSPAPGLALELWPAGSLTASARDVARFARAHLGDGSVDGGRILSASSVDRMADRWFAHHPAVDGLGFGWLEDSHGDLRLLWHNGAIPGSFYSHLLLVPAADVGLFVVYNTDTGGQVVGDLIEPFLTEYFPQDDPPDRGPDGRPDRADALEGSYRGLRVAETSHSRLFTALQAGEVSVTIDEDGYLRTEVGGETTRWVQREPLVFDAADGHEQLAFEADGDGVSHLYLGFQAFRRRSPAESITLHGGLGVASTIGMLSGAIGWPAAYAWRRRSAGDEAESTQDSVASGNPEDASVEDERESQSAQTEEGESPTEASFGERLGLPIGSPTTARWLLVGSVAAVVLFVVGFSGGVVFDPTLLSDPPIWYRLLLLLPVAASLGVVASIAAAAAAWRENAWSRRSLVHFAVVAVSTAIVCALLYYWNLFGTPG